MKLKYFAGAMIIASAGVYSISTPVIERWEGKENQTYIDIVGVATACYGQTGKKIKIGQRFTDEQCDAMLTEELQKVAKELDQCIKRDVTPKQGAAILSLAYNVGAPTVCKSTMAKMINRGDHWIFWCPQFDRYVYAGGKRVQGLVNRRAHERRICEGISL